MRLLILLILHHLFASWEADSIVTNSSRKQLLLFDSYSQQNLNHKNRFLCQTFPSTIITTTHGVIVVWSPPLATRTSAIFLLVIVIVWDWRINVPGILIFSRHLYWTTFTVHVFLYTILSILHDLAILLSFYYIINYGHVLLIMWQQIHPLMRSIFCNLSHLSMSQLS